MIWIIGDIHGMYDPLRRLLRQLKIRQKIREEGKKGSGSDKLIFLGDYIDFGPSSREVIDAIMQEDMDCVTLAGNHEDLMLEYLNEEEFGYNWLDGNGGQDTILSFDSSDEMLLKLTKGGGYVHPEDFKLSSHYRDFFDSLIYGHNEKVEGVKFGLVHAGLDPEINLDDQLNMGNYKAFQAFRKKNKWWIENTTVWTRKEPSKKFGDYVVFNGHTPTIFIADIYSKTGAYDPESGVPFCKFTRNDVKVESDMTGRQLEFDAGLDELISINVDTGAALGHYLTAVGLGKDLGKGKPTMEVVQVRVGGSHRNRADLRSFEMVFQG